MDVYITEKLKYNCILICIAQKNTMLTIDNIISNHLSFRNIVKFLDIETTLCVSKFWARVKTQQIASVRFLQGADGVGIECVTRSYPGLERITINKQLWRHIDDEDIEVIANNCRQLKQIDIANCGQITSVSTLVRKCEELTHIKARGCYQLTDDSMKDIANNCSELKHLDVAYCNEITDIGVVSIVDNCPTLTAINVSGCNRITDSAILAIADECPNLTTLSLADCIRVTDPAVEKLANKCELLKSIYLRGCTNMSSKTIATITEKCKGITQLSYTM